MSSRPPPRRDDYDDYYDAPPPRRGPDQDFRRPPSPQLQRERERESRPPPRRFRSPSHDREFDDNIRIRERDREVSRGPPAFLRDDRSRPPEHGPMVLRKKEVETVERHRSPSPRGPPPERMRRSPPPQRNRGRSPSRGPPAEVEHLRERFVERERVRSPSEVRSREPRPVRFETRRPRSLSPQPPRPPPGPEFEERFRTRIVRKEDISSSSESPSPPPPQPQYIRGPTMEREVITHYTDVDHGMIDARPRPQPPPPQPAPQIRRRPRQEEETDIDINLSRNRTEVDVTRITRSSSRGPGPSSTHYHYHDDNLGDDRPNRRRARSDDRDRFHRDEEREITNRIDSRGRMGEAWHGATKDWELIDVPPGTERVRMDGKGGGSTTTQWENYSGKRKTTFDPERERQVSAPMPPPPPSQSREIVHVSSRDEDVRVEDRVTDIEIRKSTRKSEREPELKTTTNLVTRKKDETWTEITKELVTKEAIEEMGYSFEEAPGHFYVMQYLEQNEVQRLMDLTMRIRQSRWDDLHRQQAREAKQQQQQQSLTYYDETTDVNIHRHRHHHEYPDLLPGVPLVPYVPPQQPARRSHRHSYSSGAWDWETETLRERGHYYDQGPGARGAARGWYR